MKRERRAFKSPLLTLQVTQGTSLNHWVSPFSHLQTRATEILQSVVEMSNQKCGVWLSVPPSSRASSLAEAPGQVCSQFQRDLLDTEWSLLVVNLDGVQEQLLSDVTQCSEVGIQPMGRKVLQASHPGGALP